MAARSFRSTETRWVAPTVGATWNVRSAPEAVADLSQLLHRASLGDGAAFAALYDATSARAYGLAVRVVRDPAQAEEVVQEAYLEMWRTSARFDRSSRRPRDPC